MIIDFLNILWGGFINNLLIIQIISFCISSILLGFIVYFLFNTEIISGPASHYKEVLSDIDFSRRRNIKEWKQIQKMLKSKKDSQLKTAVIKADDILNEALRIGGYHGKNLEDRLSEITSVELCNIEEIKQGHKIRRRIDTEPGFCLNYGEAKTLIDIYEKALQDLNLID